MLCGQLTTFGLMSYKNTHTFATGSLLRNFVTNSESLPLVSTSALAPATCFRFPCSDPNTSVKVKTQGVKDFTQIPEPVVRGVVDKQRFIE